MAQEIMTRGLIGAIRTGGWHSNLLFARTFIDAARVFAPGLVYRLIRV